MLYEVITGNAAGAVGYNGAHRKGDDAAPVEAFHDFEVLTALTLNAAASLGMADTIGSIEVGKHADLLLHAFPVITSYSIHYTKLYDSALTSRSKKIYNISWKA